MYIIEVHPPRMTSPMHARSAFLPLLIATLAIGLLLTAGSLGWTQELAPGAPVEVKKVDKVYIVGYALVVLMVGLGVLVVCHYRERKARPDLPQDLVEERLRHGVKVPGQKSG